MSYVCNMIFSIASNSDSVNQYSRCVVSFKCCVHFKRTGLTLRAGETGPSTVIRVAGGSGWVLYHVAAVR